MIACQNDIPARLSRSSMSYYLSCIVFNDSMLTVIALAISSLDFIQPAWICRREVSSETHTKHLTIF